jgi:hypothetical protein
MNDVASSPPTAPGSEESSTERKDLGSVAEEQIRQRITHVLSVYPMLSPSMLQVGIGTGISPSLWHIVLNQMCEEGIVLKRQVSATNPVTNREQTYTLISLPLPIAA